MSQNIIISGVPVIQFSHTLNCSSWERKIIIARPFTNPSITVCGMSLTSLPSQSTQKSICSTHIKISVVNKYSTQYFATSETITIARAHVAPEIIPGLPPNIAVISHIINAAWSPTIGSTHATNEKAIASGTSASATVSHDKISVLSCWVSESSRLISIIQKKLRRDMSIKRA